MHPKDIRSYICGKIINVLRKEAIAVTCRLAKEEGFFAGISSGGAVTVTVILMKELNEGTFVCIICDIGNRYLLTDLF